jgi:hypothetical protein
VSRQPDAGGLAPCSGPCFALPLGGALIAVACLTPELGRLRRGAWEPHLAEEIAAPLARSSAARPVCGAGFAVNAYGVRIAMRANEPAVLRRALDRLPPGWRPVYTQIVQRLYSFVVPRRRGLHTLYGDTVVVAERRTLNAMLDSFESDVQIYVAERAPRHVFVHAGVVGWRGQAILLPGPSMSGKSRLVAELIRAGATYYSDEYAVLDATGRVHPYDRPLSLRQEGRSGPRRYPAEALGGQAGRRPLPVGLVVLSSYRPGARWRPRPLTAARGALAILDHAVAARSAPARVLAAIGNVAKGARFFVSPRGEAKETAHLLLTRN